MFEDIIPPVDKALLESELIPERFVKHTNSAGNQIYITSSNDSPHIMTEIGRLRELTFRNAGGGTGHSVDIDQFDTGESPFLQLFVWNPEEKEIVGGYRFIHGKDMIRDESNRPVTPTSEIFHFSGRFINEYLPVTIELGRSWVQPKYQPSNDFRKGIYSLDNLWDGLGGLVKRYPEVDYFFGKITMYPSFNQKARDLILGFLTLYFPDDTGLVTPFPELRVTPKSDIRSIHSHFRGGHFDHDFRVLVRLVRHHGEQVPPLVSAYMSLSSTMKTFGTSINPHFGNVEETGILVRIPDIYPDKVERHIKQ